MGRSWVFGLVAVGGLAITPVSSARLSKRHICKVHRCTTVAASQQIRVIEASERTPRELDEREYRADFAVWTPTGRVTELANGTSAGFENSPYVREAKISGTYVAYRISGLNFDAGRYDAPSYPERIERANAKTGKRTSTATVDVAFGGGDNRADLHFAVTRRGTVAWAFFESIFSTEATVDVLPGGSNTTTTLAHGKAVEPASLALVPGHLYWLEGGVARTFVAP